MIKVSRVIHFEVSVDNPERAKKFYENVFGWNINKWGPEDYWLVMTGEKTEPGIDGALKKRDEPGLAKHSKIYPLLQ